MPPNLQVFGEAARIWGGVNPTDDEAVDAFYMVTFLSLSEEDKAEILEYILCNEDTPEFPVANVCQEIINNKR